MEDHIYSLPTKNINIYLLERDKSLICYMHPSLKQGESITDEYYKEKYEYLKKYLFRQDNFINPNVSRMSPEAIKNKVANLNQLVFEVTDTCNLNCKYCGYGDIYESYDKREKKKLTFQQVKPLLDYLLRLWKNEELESYNDITYISFYGGEPLLNMSFIEDVVYYIENLNIKGRHFVYSMTTNAILLDKYADFLEKYKIRLLISLDGNIDNNGYRVDFSGQNSFTRITQSVDILSSKYPDYFEKSVNFNAVLHNKNSVLDIYNFFHTKYNKIPSIGELNDSGIREEKQEEFNSLYKNSYESLHQEENYKELEQNLFMNASSYKSSTLFLHQYWGSVFKTYNDLLYEKNKKKFLPTGTCIPFSKKMFVTVNGKILACERIDQQFALGKIENSTVVIDYENIANTYNNYYDKLQSQCSKCYRGTSCLQCVYYIKNLNENPICHGYVNEEMFTRYFSNNMTFFEEHPKDYFRIMKEVTIE